MWVVRLSDKQLEVVRAVLRSEEHRGPALEGRSRPSTWPAGTTSPRPSFRGRRSSLRPLRRASPRPTSSGIVAGAMRSPPSPRSEPSASGRSASARRATGAPPRRAVRRFRLVAAALVAAGFAPTLLTACGDDEPENEASAQRFDSQRAFELIQLQVEEGPRPAGSPASRELAEHLEGALPDGAIERVPGGLQNVVGTLPGSEPAIVVAAHYDTEATIPGHVGATDGAAGTAAVVELARALERELPDEHREVRFVLFDGEEEPPGCPDARF